MVESIQQQIGHFCSDHGPAWLSAVAVLAGLLLVLLALLRKLRQEGAQRERALEQARQQQHELELLNAERERAAETLRKAYGELEDRVRERTAELSKANENLRREIQEHEQSDAERRRLEQRVQQAQKIESLGLMAGGIAHDLNNILMVILGNLELIRGDLPPDNAGRNYLDDVEKAARRAASIAAQMLAYAGKGQFFVQPMDLCELVTDMMETIEASISKKAHLRCDLDADVPPVAIDVTQIQQVVMNLVTNASDALEERGGAITIRVRALDCETGYLAKTWLKTGLPAGRYVALEVADTGCGMNELALSRVFDPFFTTKFFGRGLGLPAVLGIVRGHRGAVDVESEPGKGTVFRVLLPAVQGPVVALAALEAPVGLWRGRGTVLLVDDEDTVRVLGCRMLEKLGFRALTAANGREAVRIFERQGREITCVLLDLTMPHMDGQETLLELRRLRKDVCVVLSSGYNEEDMVRRFRDAPPAGYIHKPYTLLELSARLRTVLEPSWSSFLGNGVQV